MYKERREKCKNKYTGILCKNKKPSKVEVKHMTLRYKQAIYYGVPSIKKNNKLEKKLKARRLKEVLKI